MSYETPRTAAEPEVFDPAVLDGLSELPTSKHVDIFDSVHQVLSSQLAATED